MSPSRLIEQESRISGLLQLDYERTLELLKAFGETRNRILEWCITLWVASIGAFFIIINQSNSTYMATLLLSVVLAPVIIFGWLDLFYRGLSQQILTRAKQIEHVIDLIFRMHIELSEDKSDPELLRPICENLYAELDTHKFGVSSGLKKWRYEDAVGGPAAWYSRIYIAMIILSPVFVVIFASTGGMSKPN